MIRVLFTDFDGVLSINGHDSVTERIVPERVSRLNDIVRRTGCIVVVSSTWRYSPLTKLGASAAQLEAWLRDAGYLYTIHGVTPVHRTCAWAHEIEETRGGEILAWLATRTVRVEAWAALDDLSIRGIDGHLVQTDADVGLSDSDVEATVAIFGEVPCYDGLVLHDAGAWAPVYVL